MVDAAAPEIVEDFEREVLGPRSENVPKVTWTVTNATGTVGDHPVVGRQLVGHVDNRPTRRSASTSR